jgi:8-oxo-dGTP pyrophosphatase MutT (NUDIX family)
MISNNEIIKLLEEELKKPLPGEEAQYRMAPAYRPHMTKQQILAYNPKLGGVMLLLYEKNSELHIVFTQRREYKGVHSAQMSFPGGKKDEGDETLVQTALRETCEEIGVSAGKIQLLGQLTEIYIPPSNFLVYPSIGYGHNITSFSPQESEVAQIVEIPLTFFFDKQNVNMQAEVRLFGDNIVHVPAYIFGTHIIWGATAIMLSEFTAVMEGIMQK